MRACVRAARVGGTIQSVMRRSLGIAVAAAALAAWPGATRAADAEVRTGRPTALTQELIGIELTPASMALDSSVSRFQAGYGGNLRLFRHRWERLYVIPIEAGLYVGEYFGRNVTIAAHLMAEGGVIVPGTGRRLELGLGTGIGGTHLDSPLGCGDSGGGCVFHGGNGWVVSLAARYLIIDRPGGSTGVGVRAIFPQPLSDPTSTAIVLFAFDFAFGMPAIPPTASTPASPVRTGPAD